MKTLKITPMIFLGLLTSSIHLVSNHKINDLGQTELIQYVIKQDALLKEAKEKVVSLEKECFKEKSDDAREASKHDQYNVIGTPEKLRSLADAREKLENILFSTRNKINLIALDRSQLAAKDTFGKTALNYCYTYEIYNQLREIGVPFQYDAWLYFNRLKFTAAGVAITMAGAVAYDYYTQAK